MVRRPHGEEAVDRDVARLEFRGDGVGTADVARVDVRSEPVLGVVGHPNAVDVVVERHDGQYGPEALGLGELGAVVDVSEH